MNEEDPDDVHYWVQENSTQIVYAFLQRYPLPVPSILTGFTSETPEKKLLPCLENLWMIDESTDVFQWLIARMDHAFGGMNVTSTPLAAFDEEIELPFEDSPPPSPWLSSEPGRSDLPAIRSRPGCALPSEGILTQPANDTQEEAPTMHSPANTSPDLTVPRAKKRKAIAGTNPPRKRGRPPSGQDSLSKSQNQLWSQRS